jgi:hypothetical protein
VLRDVLGDLSLSTYPEVALVFFFVLFLGIVAYVMFRRKESWEQVRRLPLDDSEPAGPDRVAKAGPREGRSDG